MWHHDQYTSVHWTDGHIDAYADDLVDGGCRLVILDAFPGGSPLVADYPTRDDAIALIDYVAA